MNEQQKERIVGLIDYARCNPDDADSGNIASEIEGILEDHIISENTKSLWNHQRCLAD